MKSYMNSIVIEDLEIIKRSSKEIDEYRGSTFFITGGTGLIGSYIIKSLLYADKNIKIVALVRNLDKAKSIFGSMYSKINWIEGDINESIQYPNLIDYIIHCASVTTSKVMVDSPVETIKTALLGTNNVLDFAKNKNVKSMVYISSMEVYGSLTNLNRDVSEEMLGYIDIQKVRSNYPECKRMCENMCVAYMSEYNVPVKIARLAQTFGPGILPWENRVFAQFARSVVNHENIVLHTKGQSEGNYCYIRDAIMGLFVILSRGKNGEAYNVSNPKSHTTVADMAKMLVEKVANNAIDVVFDIPEGITYGYAADTKLKLNSDKLQSLGWSPVVDLEESYKRLVSSIKEEMEVNVIEKSV